METLVEYPLRRDRRPIRTKKVLLFQKYPDLSGRSLISNAKLPLLQLHLTDSLTNKVRDSL